MNIKLIIAKFLVSFTICFLSVAVIVAQPGSLDPVFGNGGKVIGSSISLTDNSVALQTDGKIVVATTVASRLTVLRYNANGTLDTSFGTGGSVAVEFFVGLPSGGSAIAVQIDGKIVAGGYTVPLNASLVNQSHFAIARFNSNGSLDNSFDTDGRVTTSVASISKVKDIVIQPDGKILATGEGLFRLGPNIYRGTSIFAYRYNVDGSLDTGFGTDGKAALSFEVPNPPIAGSQNAESLALQTDGKIVVVGTAFVLGTTGSYVGGAAIARFLPNGQPDTTFDSDGKVFTILDTPGSNIAYQIRAVAVQPNGRILAAGSFTSNSTAFPYDFAVFGYTAAGAADTSFDGDGKLISSIEAGNDYAKDIWIQPNGKIVVVGESDSGLNKNFAVARYNLDGSADNSFDGDGKAITDFGNNTVDSGSQAVLQPDGKIVAVGVSDNQLALVRYLGDSSAPRRTFFDFDGDGKADFSVFRASENKWYILQSSNFTVIQKIFAVAGDVPVPADYDGDGKTDVAIFRPSSGDWWYLSSINNAQIPIHWGQAGDIPRPSDFDGDGKADFIVYRPSNSVWYRFGSTGVVSILAFGIAEDKPLIGDFDGDGKSDFAIFRPSTGDWWYSASSAGGQFRAIHWGALGDIPAPADYDGDGKTDFAVFRPSNGGWYIANSGNGSFTILSFGLSSDKPIAADYDGDGKADIAVYRPSTGTWYLMQTTAGFGALQFGNSTDVAIPNAFVQ